MYWFSLYQIKGKQCQLLRVSHPSRLVSTMKNSFNVNEFMLAYSINFSGRANIEIYHALSCRKIKSFSTNNIKMIIEGYDRYFILDWDENIIIYS
jgi:hypothetical protein